MNTFTHELIKENLYRIIEKSGVCFYIFIGEDRALLFDSGYGLGNIREYIEKNITDKPVTLILSHGHLDHVGGAALFDEVYMNRDDDPVLFSFGTYEVRQSRFDEPVQPDYKGEIKNIRPYDEFDVGNETVVMLPVKGHTPGMMVPLLKKTRAAIFGDACGVGVLLFNEFSSCVSEYRESLLTLKKYENDYDLILRNHGTFCSEKDLLDNVIECCDLILAGKDDHHPVERMGKILYEAKQRDEKENRIDGKFGDILYTEDKAR